MDREVVVWLSEHRIPPLDLLAAALAVVGVGGLVWVTLAIVVGVSRSHPLRVAVPVALTVWATDLVALALRHAVGRVRPYEAIAEVERLGVGGSGPSFPSGHAAASVVGAILVGAVAPGVRPWLWLLAAAIAVSRVYGGFHYPTDVLAGAGLGAATGLLALAALRRGRWAAHGGGV